METLKGHEDKNYEFHRIIKRKAKEESDDDLQRQGIASITYVNVRRCTTDPSRWKVYRQ